MTEQATSKVTRLAVSHEHVKTIKDALKAHDILDKRTRIRLLEEADVTWHPVYGPGIFQDQWFSIPVKGMFPASYNDDALEDSHCYIVDLVDMRQYRLKLWLHTYETLHSNRRSETETSQRSKNPLDSAIVNWLKAMSSPADLTQVTRDSKEVSCAHEDTSSAARISSYTVYSPMLLLPSTALSKYFLDGELSKHLPLLYESLCRAFKVTHIALNASIPLSASTQDSSTSISGKPSARSNLNVLRSPTGLTPLYGDFGPALDLDHVPDASDFESAFWCTTRQNDVFQTWAPRYTMFSRGNISEKARILTLDSVRGLEVPGGALHSSTVDLYAGIGYFAFSYAEAGFQRIFCWEINPWSVEGLRRGAERNRWQITILGPTDTDDMVIRRVNEQEDYGKLVIFQESNQHASGRIMAFRPYIPPIRHVNCGYLPSSKDSWKTAVDVIDSDKGGWVHAHENIAKKDIEKRKREIIAVFTDLVSTRFGPSSRRVSCSHLERVKSYAPGVIHCVLDIAITLIDP